SGLRRTNERKNRKQNADRRNWYCAVAAAAPRSRGAHLSAFHHGSRPEECFISRDSASGQASWDVAACVERVLPAPACPVVPPALRGRVREGGCSTRLQRSK